MTELLIGGLLLVTLLWTAFMGNGRESTGGMTRWMWMLTAVGLIEVLLMPTVAQSILLASVILNVQRQASPSSHMNFYEQVLGVCGIYLLLIQFDWTWLIEPLLFTLVGMGIYMGSWAFYSTRRLNQPYRITFGPWMTLEERQAGIAGGKAGDVWCGQMMTNFTQAVFCLSIAAAVALGIGDARGRATRACRGIKGRGCAITYSIAMEAA